MGKQTIKPSNWGPPLNYQKVDSAVEGITVYAPAAEPASTQEKKPTTFKCPKCGANTKYDVAAGGIACEYCGYAAKTNASKVGLNADQFEFTLATLNVAEHGWGFHRREMHCDSCGADLAVEEGTLTSTCPFCSSNKVMLHHAPDDNLRPRSLIPFKIQPENCRKQAKDWLGTGWFHPDELSNASIIERFTGVYTSFWSFKAEITSQWKAQVGYERKISYMEQGEIKTRTVIDWVWENGRTHISIADLLVCGNSHISRVLIERTQPFDLSDLVEYSPEFLAGWQAQSYDISLPAGWEIGKSIMRQKAKAACHADIRSRHVRNFSMTADFSNESWRYVLLPVYITAYTFEGKTYQVIVNGQTGKVVGQKPVAWWKVWLVIIATLIPGMVCSLIGLLLFPLLPIGVIMLIAAGIFSLNLYRKAVASEAA